MGFPEWTLWGMGLAGIAATIAIGFAYLMQLPRFMTRYGLGESGSNRQARVATGIGFALSVLAFGFFLAGVPLDMESASSPNTAASQNETPTIENEPEDQISMLASTPDSSDGVVTTESGTITRTTTTGAFAAPPAASSTISATLADAPTQESIVDTPEAPTLTPVEPETPTSTPRPTLSPTPTTTSTPTATPSPTVTATPIEGETAIISTFGSTLWVRRTPGGQPLALVQDGDLVILSTGHAHQGGLLWREVSTVAGETGWVQEEYLSFEDQS